MYPTDAERTRVPPKDHVEIHLLNLSQGFIAMDSFIRYSVVEPLTLNRGKEALQIETKP